MRYVFFGTPNFAARVLRKLIEGGQPPLAVVCNPDRPTGRKQIITPPPVKTVIAEKLLAHETPVLQPEEPEAIAENLAALAPQFGLVAAYAHILPAFMLHLPARGFIGVHPSLLPRYRGASPVQSAILAGEKETGVTLYLMDERMDHGPVLATRAIETDKLNSEELLLKLADLGAELLLETVPQYLDNKLIPFPQDELRATYTKKFTAADAFIPFEELTRASKSKTGTAAELWSKIRAFTPEPGAWTEYKGKRVKLIKADFKGGTLELQTIQVEGERPKPFTSF